ncbi:MAG TPA: radical SAM protein [Candidatus Ozemobacteraceae bacterium]|nr:radical SAM protein [Candidatus Ozemobacteraceae bacterium]
MKVALHLTHDCNLRCTYCYVGEKYGVRMSRETAEAAVRFAHQQSRTYIDINFFGGEPLLEKDLLWHVIDYAHQYRLEQTETRPIRFFTTTNGVAIDEAFMKRSVDHGLVLSLSLDGHAQGHDLTRTLPDGRGSFETIAANFPLILSHMPQIQVLMTQTPRNVAWLAEGVEKLYHCGFRCFVLGPNFEEPWNVQAAEEWNKQIERIADFVIDRFRHGEFISISNFDAKIRSHTQTRAEVCSCCDKNDGEIAVAPSGNLYPCLRFVKEDRDHELLIGSLRDGLDVRKRARIMAAASREWSDCLECGYRGRCFHYCSAVNFKLNGAFNQPPAFLCHTEQAVIRQADRLAEILWQERNPEFTRRYYRG